MPDGFHDAARRRQAAVDAADERARRQRAGETTETPKHRSHSLVRTDLELSRKLQADDLRRHRTSIAPPTA
jgi:hypothetical protein